MKYFLFLSFFLFQYTSCWENKDILVFKMAEHNIVEPEFIGMGGESEQYKRFVALKKKASKKEILELTQHENPTVACYAAYAAIDAGMIAANTLFSDYLQQDKSVTIIGGCLPNLSSLSVETYDRYWKSRLQESGDAHKPYTIKDSPDLQQMDSLIYYQASVESLLRYRAFNNRTPQGKFIEQIKNLAFYQGDYEAMIYVYDHYLVGNEIQLQIALEKYKAQLNPMSPLNNEIKILLAKLSE